MKVTLNWLKQYVDFDWSPAELAERLTMLGLEVEGLEEVGGGYDGIVVAEVLTRDKHPDADKLSVCRVNDGRGERQIVCGAQNFKAGDKVPLILPGASLPPKPGEKPFTIKVGKIRGIESHGMLCSPAELGLATESDGLLILKPGAEAGQPFAAYLGQAEKDFVYDLEVTPNRPDLNSVIGIAREIAAVTGGALRLPPVELPAAAAGDVANSVAVRLEDPELCPRYTARVIRGVKIGPSPDWLRHALEKVGVRSISNVVDVTNFVMLEIGQPLHAFDYHLLAAAAGNRPTIVVRRARAEERFTTLDGKEHTLTAGQLLIADAQKGIALAGVMGGLNTEINDQTRDVLIESAWFLPTNIRRTSKALGLRTESSYRFERGADVGICDRASRRAAQLILETAGGELAGGVVDAYPAPAAPRKIALRPERVNQLLGLQLAPEEMRRQLAALELRPAAGEANAFEIPSWRVDLKREADLIEEICRLHGVARIPATPPRGAHGTNEHDAVHDQLAEARRLLTAMGLDEAQGQTLIGDGKARLACDLAALVALAHPLSADMNVLRPSLLPGLLDSLRHNLTRGNHDVALFETGRVFARRDGRTTEERRLAIALTGRRAAPFWSGGERDALHELSDLKGVLDEFLEQFGLRGVQFQRRDTATELFLESAEISLGGKLPLGQIGRVQPRLAKQYDLRDAVLLAELNLDQLLARRNAARSFKALPGQPSSRRDVAMLVPEAVTHEDVLRAARKAKPDHLESVELFDVFRGANIPDGQKSVAYAFTYRHAERTLKDTEVNAAHEQVVAEFKKSLRAAVR